MEIISRIFPCPSKKDKKAKEKAERNVSRTVKRKGPESTAAGILSGKFSFLMHKNKE